MTYFNQEYYDSLTDEQKRHYLDDCNLRFTMDRVYNLTGSQDREKIGRGQTKPLFICDDLAFYKRKVTKRIHPKRNRQHNPNRKRINLNKKARAIKRLLKPKPKMIHCHNLSDVLYPNENDIVHEASTGKSFTVKNYGYIELMPNMEEGGNG